jgi:glycosyltransferase involved in cell wall biosynthesis
MRVTTASAGDLAAAPTTAPCLVSVVIPCLNEAENIERCVALARETLELNVDQGARRHKLIVALDEDG